MIRAAGILFLTQDNQALFLKRGNGSDHPGEWCWPGGQLEGDESAEEAAEREAVEEAGPAAARLPRMSQRSRALLARSIAPAGPNPIAEPQPAVPAGVVEGGSPSPDAAPAEPPAAGQAVDFTTFLQRVEEPFPVALCDEHTGYAWADIRNPPEPLHPGCRTAIDRLFADELGVARMMAEGRLTSPQKYQNVWLFALRITGTGGSYRAGLDEHVWRDPSIYMNEEFRERCNGLAVILEHPEGKRGILNGKEFKRRVIGSIMLPYLRPDIQEVRGISKVYDEEAAALMCDHQLSTSPAVVFPPGVGQKVALEDGSKLLIEGKPSLLDHLAVCPLGVWDKGGPPRGVVNSETQPGDVVMADEDKGREEGKEEAREDAARADAMARMDAAAEKMMSACDAMTSRMDRMEARMDGWDKARKDAEEAEKEEDRKDSKARRDAGDEGEGEEEGETKQVAADKARKDAEEAEAKKAEEERADKARKDAEEDEKEKEREDAARADAAAAELRQRLSEVERRMPVHMTDVDYRALVAAQAKADGVFAVFADSAPRPLSGEDQYAYRRRVAEMLKVHSPKLATVNLAAIQDSAAFDVMEGMIYADALAVGEAAPDVEPGTLREVRRADEAGRMISTFHGTPGAWLGAFSGSRRYLTGINKEA